MKCTIPIIEKKEYSNELWSNRYKRKALMNLEWLIKLKLVTDVTQIKSKLLGIMNQALGIRKQGKIRFSSLRVKISDSVILSLFKICSKNHSLIEWC